MVRKKVEGDEAQRPEGPGPAGEALLAQEPSPDTRLGVGIGDEARERRLDEQEDESFPASDPHSDWAGPPD